LDTATDVVPGADTWVKVSAMPVAPPPLTVGETATFVPLVVFSEAVELAFGAGVGVAATAVGAGLGVAATTVGAGVGFGVSTKGTITMSIPPTLALVTVTVGQPWGPKEQSE
jgi:hypothetical protein